LERLDFDIETEAEIPLFCRSNKISSAWSSDGFFNTVSIPLEAVGRKRLGGKEWLCSKERPCGEERPRSKERLEGKGILDGKELPVGKGLLL